MKSILLFGCNTIKIIDIKQKKRYVNNINFITRKALNSSRAEKLFEILDFGIIFEFVELEEYFLTI